MTPLRLEQPGQLGSINYEKKKLMSVLTSPKVTEQRSLALSLRGTEDHTNRLDLVGRSSSMDSHWKPTSPNVFRGHRRAASGNILTLFKHPEALQLQGKNSAPRQLDKFAVDRLAASILHSSTTLERSLSMSRVCQKVASEVEHKRHSGPLPVGERSFPAKQEESLSEQSTSLFKRDDEPRMTEHVGGNQSCLSSQGVLMKGDSELPSICPQAFENVVENENLTSINRDETYRDRSFHSETNRILLLECDNIEIAAVSATEVVEGIQLNPQSVTGEVTKEELTEAPLISSTESDGSITSSDERNINAISSSWINETGSEVICSSSACLTKSVSFENGAGSKLLFKRKRRRSVSASGLGAMLLKVVGVPDSGKMVMRKAGATGQELMSGVDAIRARQYLPKKTAQISENPAPSLSALPASADTKRQSRTENSVKSTHTKVVDIETDYGGDFGELVQHSKAVPDHACSVVGFVTNSECKSQSVEADSPAQPAELKGDLLFNHNTGEGFGATSTHETGCIDQQAARECQSEIISTHLPDLGNVNTEHISTHERRVLALVEGQRVVCDKFVRKPIPDALSSAGANTSATDDGFDGRLAQRTESNTRASNFDDSAEGFQTTNPCNEAHELPLISIANISGINQERSRSFTSRLQAPTGTLSCADTFRLIPSSVSILANPSFSSSQCQDRIWEEQAEIYSSGGRGTPGREDDPSAANAMLHSPSPVATAISSEDHQVSSSNPVRKGHTDSSGRHPSTVSGAKERWKKGKKRGRSPRTPLRSLLSDDGHSKASGSGMRSPTGGHFMQQIMFKIRGNSPKAPSPKSPEPATAKRRNTWSSCICFSIK